MRHAALSALFILLFTYAALAASTVTPSFSDLSIAYSKEEKLVLTGKTTLPDGTILSALIVQLSPERKGLYTDMPMDYPESFDVVVKGGAFASWFPTIYEKGLAEGKYAVQISIPPQDALGLKNSRLSGPGVVTESNGLKSFSWEIIMTVPALPPHPRQ